MATKRCPACKTIKPLDAFYRNASYCKDCSKEHNKAWYAKHGKKHDQEKNARLETRRRVSTHRKIKRRLDDQFRQSEITGNSRSRLKRLGLTTSEFQAMKIAQNNLCAICGKPNTRSTLGRVSELAVDHDHATGKIRQLLCHFCNAGLGHFKDSIDLLVNAALYLQRHGSGVKIDSLRVRRLLTEMIAAGQGGVQRDELGPGALGK